jgi:hypothetical protein
MRRVFVGILAICLAACASDAAPKPDDGPRPPQGKGPGGTDFGYWRRDAEGAVDSAFRTFILARYKTEDAAAARAQLETDRFECKDSQRTDAKAAAGLECIRMYQQGDDVHAWTVGFWRGDRAPRARYTRTHIRDPLRNYDAEKKKQG